MKKTTFLLFATLLLLSCKSDKEYPYEYWSRLSEEKYKEIIALTESVTCTDIEEFEIHGNFLVHASIKTRFDRLMEELNHMDISEGPCQ
ncbi:hypothetical protein H8B06_15345 [Sphingobacterium sp. DN00404]|uniref:Uncharacterized protein n=1 Tax=Sphingobacterium micropteri TaxID=2763501 RepID=A0ABR7YS97_9SPHI|nr:hypothetical protein [Sphingobacterium micropteri]MBD1434208.1 hypothetical protein [Sphingobacterium micropteri]